MIRILIVEDSITQREILRQILGEYPEFEVVGEAPNGRRALELVREVAPDVILMDIVMPELDGVEATRRIMQEHPIPILILTATLTPKGINMGLEALRSGAVSVMEKPDGAALLHLAEVGPQLRDEIRLVAGVKLRKRASKVPSPAIRSKFTMKGRIGVVGMCASSGGPPVLVEILSALPKPFPLPLLLVQHITLGFEEGFVRWLAETTGQPVQVAVHGKDLEPGVWFAPGGKHLVLDDRNRMALRPKEPSDIHCPSGDALFRSLARQAGPRAAGVLLTGMGSDGAPGLLALKEAGGKTIIQDEESCLVWGMPKVAKELGAAQAELSPPDVAIALSSMAERR